MNDTQLLDQILNTWHVPNRLRPLGAISISNLRLAFFSEKCYHKLK